MKASELVARLGELIEEHGDLDVYSVADYDFVERAEYDDPREYVHRPPTDRDRPRFTLEG